MIPGFNTDVKWQGRVFHVQTENIGSQQQVETLIFAGGEILAAKRTSYLDPDAPLSPAEIAAFLHHQHEVITNIIKAGFIDELHHRETVKELERLVGLTSNSELEPPAPQPVPQVVTPKPAPPPPPSEPAKPLDLMSEVFGTIDEVPASANKYKPLDRDPFDARRPPAATSLDGLPNSPSANIPGYEIEFEILGEISNGRPPVAPVEPKEVITANGLPEPTQPEPAQPAAQSPPQAPVPTFITEAKLKLELYGKDEFFAGENGPLMVVIKGADTPFPVKNAEVTVKLVGTTFRPMLWRQVTGANGLAMFDITIPNFTSGTAVFVITATALEGECQERFPVRRATQRLTPLHPF